MSYLASFNPIRFFIAVTLLGFFTFATFVVVDDFVRKKTFSLAGKQSTGNEESVGVPEVIDSHKSPSKTGDFIPEDIDLYGIDDTLLVDYVKGTKPSPKDPLREDAPAPLTPTQPIAPDYNSYESLTDQDSKKDSEDMAVQYPETQIGSRKQLLCLDMAIAGVIIAALVVMFVSILHTLVDWLLAEDPKAINTNTSKTRVFHIPFLAKLDPQTKAMVFDKASQVHKV